MSLEKYEGGPGKRSSKAPKVLDEETYTENLERIIVRDFFPDHGQLKDQKDYLEAEDKKDFEKMREIALKYSTGHRSKDKSDMPGSAVSMPIPSPATFETPVVDGQCPPSTKVNRVRDDILRGTVDKNANLGYEKNDASSSEDGTVKDKDRGSGLNAFLSKYTSEDNESFENIMDKYDSYTISVTLSIHSGNCLSSADEARKRKYAWLYDAEKNALENQKQYLMLEYQATHEEMILAIENGSIESDNKIVPLNTQGDCVAEKVGNEKSTGDAKASGTLLVLPETDEERRSLDVDTWTYKAKNHFMYYPEGLPSDDGLFKKPYEIEHTNTRFPTDPFKDVLDRTKLVEAAAENAKFNVGERVGHDGKAILPTASPSVNGFGFVATPSPAPGVNMSPIMTWGTVDGTPVRIDGSGTPTPGPSFKFPKESRRDELMYKMVDDHTKKNRAKKQAALKQVKSSLLAGTPRRVGSIMSSERMNTLSPAAKRLVTGNKKLGLSSDRRLKQSYTPTPTMTEGRGDLTPISKTPTPNSRIGGTPKESGSNTPSITDDLLDIPSKKKKKAADFF